MKNKFSNIQLFIVAILVSGIISAWCLFFYISSPLHFNENVTLAVSPQLNFLEPTIINTSKPSQTVTFTTTVSPTFDCVTQTMTPPVMATFTPSSTSTATFTPTIETPIYVFPIKPISDAYYQQGHHDYPATDIFAPEGTAYLAVTSGIVDFVRNTDEWVPEIDNPANRGGIAIAIIGDDGIRYYGSHLLAINGDLSPGYHVEAGQILGFVGNTGNARYVTPHLHFGISHPTYPEDWEVRRGEIDPYPYLEAWKDGVPLEPEL